MTRLIPTAPSSNRRKKDSLVAKSVFALTFATLAGVLIAPRDRWKGPLYRKWRSAIRLSVAPRRLSRRRP